MSPHFEQQLREDGLPEIHADNSFMSTEGHPSATILVAKAKATKTTMATVVAMEGGSIEFPAREYFHS